MILGQVDEILVRTVERLLKVDRQCANRIMGSSKVSDNIDIWGEVIRSQCCARDDLDHITKFAGDESRSVSEGRNLFFTGGLKKSVMSKKGTLKKVISQSNARHVE